MLLLMSMKLLGHNKSTVSILQSALANARVMYVDTPPSACFLFQAAIAFSMFSNNRRPRFESFTAGHCPELEDRKQPPWLLISCRTATDWL